MTEEQFFKSLSAHYERFEDYVVLHCKANEELDYDEE